MIAFLEEQQGIGNVMQDFTHGFFVYVSHPANDVYEFFVFHVPSIAKPLGILPSRLW